MNVKNLRCENQKNPIGIDVKKPKLSWIIDTDCENFEQLAYQIKIYDNNMKLVEDTKRINSSKSINIKIDYIQLKPYSKYYWKVKVWDKNGLESDFSSLAFFETGLMDQKWDAHWIGMNNSDVENKTFIGGSEYYPCVYLKKEFSIDKKIKKANLYATSLGVYKPYINGKALDDTLLSPGWTDYNGRILYQSYDITSNLDEGDNTLNTLLGDGWYVGNIAIAGREQYGSYPLLFSCKLRIEFEDGRVQFINSDSSWRAKSSKILYSDIQTGEKQDNRICMDNDENWMNVVALDKDLKPTSQINEGIKVVKDIDVISLKEKEKGIYIADFGQNFAGFVCLKVKGKRDTQIKIRHGEMLYSDGSLYTENLRSATAEDYFILSGGGIETYEPVFTFHGFRYIEISTNENIEIVDIKARAIQSNMEKTLSLETKSELVNKIYSNVFWSLRSNFISIPTDCPQRDERMGWTGDGQIFAQSAMFFTNSYSFFKSWYEEILIAQKDNGAYTDVAPMVKTKNGKDLVGNGNAGWADAGVIIPWTIYLTYGDKDILKNSYTSIQKFIKYLEKNSSNYIRPEGPLGDWLNADEVTNKQLMETAYFAYSVKLAAKISNVLDKKKEYKYYIELFKKIKSAYQNKFVYEDGTIDSDSQTSYLISLKFDLLDQNIREKAISKLVQNIIRKDYHLSTGFIGIKYLLPILSENGHNDIAYRILMQKTYPSWGYTIENGATTIWERWNSYSNEKGFGDVKMNSFNHYSLGSVVEWMIRYMAGIDFDEKKPAFKHFYIKPYVNKVVGSAKVSFDSVYGRIESKWEYKDDSKVKFDFEVPPNTKATFIFEDINREYGSGKYTIEKQI